MEIYEQIIKDTLETLISDGYETKEQILKRWEEGDTQNDFGNIDGSRTCSTYEAEETLKKAGFPFNSDINELLESVGYNIGDLLERGAEVIDVIICELLALSMVDKLRNTELVGA